MIGHVTLGTNVLPCAASFYDVLRTEGGAHRYMETDRLIGWAVAPDKPVLAVCRPWGGNMTWCPVASVLARD